MPQQRWMLSVFTVYAAVSPPENHWNLRINYCSLQPSFPVKCGGFRNFNTNYSLQVGRSGPSNHFISMLSKHDVIIAFLKMQLLLRWHIARFYAPVTVRTVLEAFVFRLSVMYAYVIIYWTFVNTISYDIMQLQCSWGHEDELIRFLGQNVKGQGHSETIMWSNKHFGMHFLTYLRNACMYFSETYHMYSLPGPNNRAWLFKVMDPKVKVTDNIFRKCTFLAETHQSTVHCGRPSSSHFSTLYAACTSISHWDMGLCLLRQTDGKKTVGKTNMFFAEYNR